MNGTTAETIGKTTARNAVEVDVKRLVPTPENVRGTITKADIEKLAGSIERLGLIQPIAVVEKGDKYEIVGGNRRFEAVKLLGWKTVSVHVLADEDTALKNVAENTARIGVDSFRLADRVVKMTVAHDGQEAEYSLEDAAKALGISRSHVSNLRRLIVGLSPTVLAKWRKDPNEFPVSLLLSWVVLSHEEQDKACEDWLGGQKHDKSQGQKRRGGKQDKHARRGVSRAEVREMFEREGWANTAHAKGQREALAWVLGETKRLDGAPKPTKKAKKESAAE